ncbi:hypothetical protein [Algoriphagus antarcticus]|uniref:Sulfite dehydrogenase (Cytochrome) subunit SorB n=1 Tax=Algoriphagus antarcticus TaxID=238540 RepID=A0A3E0DKA3_9BACT|nr:hypothetical protein [Algoriphagus antarcticus]REG82499.1 hypothetical protein C8N25_12130 [Algoriphagus antarcticus]
MNKLPENKPSSSKRENLQFFNGLFKSVAGLVGIVVLLVGVVLLLIFRPEISAWQSTDSVELPAELASSQSDPADQVVEGKDLVTGLITGEGLELIKGNCISCHSSALILQNRFTREGWHDKIVWMQETQGLWDLGENEAKILDYLATNYAPEAPKGRRIPLTGIEWYELKD